MNSQLAIIIPYYKLKYFKETLESLSNQTDKRFSVYIGNDCSPENPEILLHSYQNKFQFSYTKFDDNFGGTNLVAQWERCIALSKNEKWLMILGDDDTLSENTVAEFYNNLPKVEAKNIQVIRLASRLIDEDGTPTSELFKNPEFELAGDSYMRIFKGDGRSTLTEHFFTRKTYEKNRFKNFPVAFGSDNVAWLEFPEMGKIFSTNDAFANIRISAEHLSSKDDGVLKYQRREGIYLFNRYIIQNYSKFFGGNDRFLILKKAYKNLRYSSRNKLKTFEFILFMIKNIGFSQTLKIIKENRNS